MKKDYFLGISEEGFHKVFYKEWGKSKTSTVPVLCLHGLSRHAGDFDDLAAYLVTRNLHVFCPDVVGRGDSDWFKNPVHYTYEQYVSDMNALIARIHAQQIDWIGTSMGGLIGLFLAAQPKTPIRRLVLNDIGPQIPLKAITQLKKYAVKDPTFTTIEEAKSYFKTVYADFGISTEAKWQAFTEKNLHKAPDGIFHVKIDQKVKVISVKNKKIGWQIFAHPKKALEGILFDVDLWEFWRKVTCPVLVIHGKKSDFLPSEIIQKMQLIHPETEVLSIENSGHAPALLEPYEHEYISNWLTKPV